MDTIPQDRSELFASIQRTLQKTHPKLRDGWYIAVASTLIAHNQTTALKHLYIYLLSSNDLASKILGSANKIYTERLREVCMKIWTIVGIPKVVTAFVALAQAEKEVGEGGETNEDRKLEVERRSSLLAPSSSSPTPLTTRGHEAMHSLYLSNLPGIFSAVGSHEPSLTWLEEDIIYGLFLSDPGILGSIETELVVLPGIVAQDVRPQDVQNLQESKLVGANDGMQTPAMWHVRGLIRLGVPREDVEVLLDVIGRVAREVGGVEARVTDGWIKAEDVDIGE